MLKTYFKGNYILKEHFSRNRFYYSYDFILKFKYLIQRVNLENTYFESSRFAFIIERKKINILNTLFY